MLTLPPKTVIVAECDRIDAIYLVEAGVVSLSQRIEGLDVVVGLRSSGAALGACCAVKGRRHGVTVRSLNAVRARMLPLSAFEASRASCLTVATWLQGILADESESLARWMVGLFSRSAEQRLVVVLSELFRWCSEMRSDGSRRLLVPETVEHLASLVHVGRECASRALHDLIHAGVVARATGGWFIMPASSPLLSATAFPRSV